MFCSFVAFVKFLNLFLKKRWMLDERERGRREIKMISKHLIRRGAVVQILVCDFLRTFSLHSQNTKLEHYYGTKNETPTLNHYFAHNNNTIIIIHKDY
jgi:hypothetical protein